MLDAINELKPDFNLDELAQLFDQYVRIKEHSPDYIAINHDQYKHLEKVFGQEAKRYFYRDVEFVEFEKIG